MKHKLLCLRQNSVKLALALVLAASGPVFAGQEPLHYLAVSHPEPSLLAPPPLPGSAEQASDMAQVVAVHQACTSNQAALAFSEKKFSIFNFTPAIGDVFKPGKFPKTEAFFTRVQKEAETVADEAKVSWKRPRPFTVNTNLASGKLEKSFSYPSGHSTEGMVLALVLAEVFPDRRDAILAVGRDLGWHRVWIARHYPTDIYAGRVYAQAIVRSLMANPDFQRDLAEVKAEVRTEVKGPAKAEVKAEYKAEPWEDDDAGEHKPEAVHPSSRS
jgi:acid phosphatase (class A)